NVVVTIAGGFAASVYANIANYSGSGGNGSTTGTFAGNGATTSPLSGAPSFNDPPPSRTSSTTSSTSANSKTQGSPGANIASSGNVIEPTHGTRQSAPQSDAPMLTARRLASAKTTTTSTTVNVSDSGQLLSLLASASPDPSGKITIPASKSGNNSHNSIPGNAAGPLRPDRAAVDTQSSSK